jgi:hypothetical protein
VEFDQNMGQVIGYLTMDGWPYSMTSSFSAVSGIKQIGAMAM